MVVSNQERTAFVLVAQEPEQTGLPLFELQVQEPVLEQPLPPALYEHEVWVALHT